MKVVLLCKNDVCVGALSVNALFYVVCLAFYCWCHAVVIREFTHRRRRRQRERKKAIGLDKQNNNFARASGFLHISLPSLNDYNVKLPNFTFCRGREHKTSTFFFFS